MHMEAANVYSLEWNDVVYIVRNSGFPTSDCRLPVDSRDCLAVSPNWRGLKFLCAPFRISCGVSLWMPLLVRRASTAYLFPVGGNPLDPLVA